MVTITASTLYDYLQCPHKVWRDKYGPQSEKVDESNPFIELLWKKGIQHEERVIASLGKYTDLSEGTLGERLEQTIEAMKRGDALLYQGVIRDGELKSILASHKGNFL